MLNAVWITLMVLSVIFGVIDDKLTDVVNAVTTSARFAFDIALGLTGVMALWLGLMKIAEEAGGIRLLARVIAPLMSRLFPDVPPTHPAMGSMTFNIAANMLGLSNAATPLGLRAMHDLETLNKRPGVATDAMCVFLAINTSSVQLIPATAIAYLAAAGATNPTVIISTSLMATTCSTVAAIIAVKICARLPFFAEKPAARGGSV